MSLNWLQRCFSSVVRFSQQQSDRLRRPARLPFFRSRPVWVERLEDRLAPAANVTILPGASGSGALDATFLGHGGQLLFADPDVGGDTLSVGALQSVGSASNI